MHFWDHKSPIDWFYRDHPSTPDEIKNSNDKYMMDDDIVLFDNGSGKVYNFSTLSELKSKYNVVESDPDEALRAIRRAMRKHISSNGELTNQTHDMRNELTNHDRSINAQGEKIVNLNAGLNVINSNVELVTKNVDKVDQNIEIDELAIAEIAELAADTSDNLEITDGAVDELAGLAADNSDTLDATSDAVTELAGMVADDNVTLETVSEATLDLAELSANNNDEISILVDAVQELSVLVMELKDQIDTLSQS